MRVLTRPFRSVPISDLKAQNLQRVQRVQYPLILFWSAAVVQGEFV